MLTVLRAHAENAAQAGLMPCQRACFPHRHSLLKVEKAEVRGLLAEGKLCSSQSGSGILKSTI